MNYRTFFRPVGWRELELIRDSGWRAFPPRLEWQPIFYPVLNQEYAEQIAREWNTEDAFSGYCGIVTAFDLPVAFLERYGVRNVGGASHDELWVPAAELAAFNTNIREGICIVAAFAGARFTGEADYQLLEVVKHFFK